LNSPPVSLKDLKGKVVLVDFWTYSCINCIRTLPHLSRWYQTYKDNNFLIIGVHSPEFEFEKARENVIEAMTNHHIKYPVALDNEHVTWNAYANQYWPAHYLLDAKGNIRYKSFGEGHYAKTEAAIQALLLEAGLLTLDKLVQTTEPPPDADFGSIGTPEIYLGYSRINNLGNLDNDVLPDVPHTFSQPQEIEQNRFSFVGEWKIHREFAELVGDKGKLTLRYKANKANMVAGVKENSPLTLEVKLDGAPFTKENKGKDVWIKDGTSFITIDASRLYNLSDTKAYYDWHTLEITIPSPGFYAFTFTFG